MADKKISALTSATTPLAGTEVLPIVQSSATVKVAVSDLTAGRSFDALGMTLTSTDAAAAAAPLLELYRDSASPAASDTLGEIEFNGEDSAGNKQAYGLIHASILSPTSTAEQGQIHFETATAGALTEKMIIGTTNLVINEIGAVFNVRIEGDTDTDLFYTDATNDRIGVGTSSPAFKTEIVGGATTVETTLLQIRSNAGGLNTGSTISFANSTNSAATGAQLAAIRDTVSGCSLVIRTADSSGTIQNRVKISETGQFAIGTTTSVSGNTNLKFVVKSSGASDACEVQATTNGALGFDFRNASGTQVGTIAINSATTTYNTSSDYRLKNTITPMTNALAKVAQLKPCTYKWNADGSDGEGFIAHELAEVVPQCVTGEKDAVNEDGNIKPQGIDVSFLVATLTAAIQEQQALITSLTARITALETT